MAELIYPTSTAPDIFLRGRSAFRINGKLIYPTSTAPDIFLRGRSAFRIQ